MYQIRLKDGHSYDFNNYRNIHIEDRDGVKVLIMEVQYQPKSHYKRIELIPRTIGKTNVEYLRKLILEMN